MQALKSRVLINYASGQKSQTDLVDLRWNSYLQNGRWIKVIFCKICWNLMRTENGKRNLYTSSIHLNTIIWTLLHTSTSCIPTLSPCSTSSEVLFSLLSPHVPQIVNSWHSHGKGLPSWFLDHACRIVQRTELNWFCCELWVPLSTSVPHFSCCVIILPSNLVGSHLWHFLYILSGFRQVAVPHALQTVDDILDVPRNLTIQKFTPTTQITHWLTQIHPKLTDDISSYINFPGLYPLRSLCSRSQLFCGATSVYLNGCSMVVKRLPSRGNLEIGLCGLGPGGTVA